MPLHLVIVESPAKAKTIKRFLGKDYIVEASMGHVRDLPKSGLGIDVDKDFEPTYEVSPEKKTVVKNLKDALKKADDLWIATDEDREGEAIGWHLTQVLGIKDTAKVNRIVFHEITESAIKAAVEHPRTLNTQLVDAQQARRILDRLVGYTLSPFLWKKVYSGLSAGRVQSVAVRIIVDREREIQAFTAVEYWSIEAMLQTDAKQSFSAMVDKKDGKKLEIHSKEESDTILKELEGKPYSVSNLEEREVQRNPAAPFTTSTLQQEAARKLGFSVKQTMVVAQQLYEGIQLPGEGQAGLITYMRTDSVNLSEKALTDAKRVIEKHYGREYVLAEARKYKTKAKGAQEAHEAIRPTEMDRTPDSLAGVLDHQQLKLYTLIWNRTVATQMPPAEFRRVAADISAGSYSLRATGQTLLFDGFLRVYSEGKDEGDEKKEGAEDDNEKILPPLTMGQGLTCEELKPEQHFTKPPPRYTEAALVKKMEEEGIGRPSTYAPTISTIQQRGYIKKDGGKLMPEDIAFTVTDLLTEHFPEIVDLKFTASMEQRLDDIAEGSVEAKEFLGGFYNPFKTAVDTKTKEIKKSDVLKERVIGIDEDTGLEVIARTGRFGAYVQLGRMPELKKGEKRKKGEGPKTASLPKHISIDDATLEQAVSLLRFPRTLGKYEGEDLTVALGRFGPYVKAGKATASLRDIDPGLITLEEAIKVLTDNTERKKKASEPLKMLGKDPDSENEIKVMDGRYGPYVTDGTTNASLPKSLSVESINLGDAVELLARKRTQPKRAWRGKKKTK